MDTDVEILKNMDIFLNHSAFTGFEKIDFPFTAVIGCEKGHRFTSDILKIYENRHFLSDDNTFDMTSNTKLVKKLLCDEYNVQLNNKKQTLKYDLTIYPSEYFCPKRFCDDSLHKTKNTYAIHWFDASWFSKGAKNHIKINSKKKMIEERYGKFAAKLYTITVSIKENGIIFIFKRALNKLKRK